MAMMRRKAPSAETCRATSGATATSRALTHWCGRAARIHEHVRESLTLEGRSPAPEFWFESPTSSVALIEKAPQRNRAGLRKGSGQRCQTCPATAYDRWALAEGDPITD